VVPAQQLIDPGSLSCRAAEPARGIAGYFRKIADDGSRLTQAQLAMPERWNLVTRCSLPEAEDSGAHCA
jgi:hypothetical protein